MAISARKELTDEWRDSGIAKSREFAMLTDEVTKSWSGMNTRQYKNLKGLKKESLRDNMSTTELVLNMLAETATKDISRQVRPNGFEESRIVAQRGGKIAGNARKELEQELGKTVITSKTALELNHIVTGMIEQSADMTEERG